MKITYDNFTFDDKVIRTIEDKCFKVGAHNFNRYLHKCCFGGKPIIDVLKDIKHKKEYKRCDYTEQNLYLSIDEQKEIVINFYKSLSSELGKKAKLILNGEDNRYCVNITQDTSKDCSGNVSTENGSNLIHFNVNLDGGIHGLRIMAHEISHAISSFKTKSYEVINNGTENELKEYFSHLRRYDVDSIGEVESYIIESLFMNHLKKQDIISVRDLTNYENYRNYSIINNLNTILEESYIFDHIQPTINPEKFFKFVKKIGGIFKSKNYNTIMHRFIRMYLRDDHQEYSQYNFRYIIGEIISSLWFEQYSQASEQQKREMIKSFEKFLSITDTATLETACHDLVELSVGDTFKDYICHLEQKCLKDNFT